MVFEQRGKNKVGVISTLIGHVGLDNDREVVAGLVIKGSRTPAFRGIGCRTDISVVLTGLTASPGVSLKIITTNYSNGYVSAPARL
jgi:hypothetical protein